MYTTVNLGTFRTREAVRLSRLLRGASDVHKQDKILRVKLRGRGSRRERGGYSGVRLKQDLPVALAPRCAVYLYVEAEGAEKEYLRGQWQETQAECSRLRAELFRYKAVLGQLKRLLIEQE